ncbi:hypothetical protein P691DRAFT_679836 [Macrolepiota fuliginosa MF-IS2]|uniref:Uncharacterized protein n=1 Tax=Macrolepiota fuliginosa MF-IS2 TaxID=1400762 RepID=A0A9P5X1X5_9AGAR|nr:hypothetical protein P691DRAFT_679836 [Macrolepiota fuliginosa MF-IS2]
MPAPAVYVLAVVGTIGAAFAFKHFVYEPHLAPKLEQWAEEYIARRRAKRMQRQGPIPVPASIPLRRRRGNHSKHSDSTLSGSDSGDDSNEGNPSNQHSNLGQASSSRRNGRGSEFDPAFAREVGEWRSEVERSQTVSSLRHRTNINAHVMDQVRRSR